MKARDFDARCLDVRAFAKAGADLAGDWSLAGFERLAEALVAPGPGEPAARLHWSARGAEVAEPGGAPQVWLHLHADATVPMVCQRCLKPCQHTLQFDRQFLFVPDEASAAGLDADVEHEVLVSTRELDLHELLEDELLLDLPIVPRHDVCPDPLPMPVDDASEPSAEHPFAALASLRGGSS